MNVRLTIIDSLKGIAAQLIVLHHLVAYGPLGLALGAAAPAISDWLYNDVRMAVQIFLVIGGYLAAQALAKHAGTPWREILRRYVRLAVPFIAAVLIAVACAALARLTLDDDMVPDAPGFLQLLAHAFLLHGVSGQSSLSAGAWYVAIDFQLFALLAALLWLCRFARLPHLPAILLFAVLSLFWFNRHPALDDYAIYFFGAYGLGALAFWAGQWKKPALGFALIAVLGVAACMIDWRARIFLATLIALLLLATRNLRFGDEHAGVRLAAYFGRNSYALFLIHFPLLLLGNAIFAWLALGVDAGLACGLIVWLCANIAADLFYRRVEKIGTETALARMRIGPSAQPAASRV